MPLVLPGLTACCLQRGRRVGTPGLQPEVGGARGSFLVLPGLTGGAKLYAAPLRRCRTSTALPRISQLGLQTGKTNWPQKGAKDAKNRCLRATGAWLWLSIVVPSCRLISKCGVRMPLVLPGLTACCLQRGRRVGTPGLQPGVDGARGSFLVLPGFTGRLVLVEAPGRGIRPTTKRANRSSSRAASATRRCSSRSKGACSIFKRAAP
jgi:hypothetical protein